MPGDPLLHEELTRLRLLAQLDRVLFERDTVEDVLSGAAMGLVAHPALGLLPEALVYLYDDGRPTLTTVVGEPPPSIHEVAYEAAASMVGGLDVTTVGPVVSLPLGERVVGAIVVRPRLGPASLLPWRDVLREYGGRTGRIVEQLRELHALRRRVAILEARRLKTDDGHSPTVLVIDDDGPTRRILRRGMTRRGWTTVEAQDGEEAMKVLRASRPDVILLDLHMPTMDGFSFLAQLRSQPAWSAIPVVVVTAKELHDDDCLRLQRGYVDQIVHKEAYSRDALLDAVGRLARAAVDDPVS